MHIQPTSFKPLIWNHTAREWFVKCLLSGNCSDLYVQSAGIQGWVMEQTLACSVSQMCVYKEQDELLSSLHHSADTWTSPHIYLTGKTLAIFLFSQWSSWFCSLCIFIGRLFSSHRKISGSSPWRLSWSSPFSSVLHLQVRINTEHLDRTPWSLCSWVKEQASNTVWYLNTLL